MMVAQNRDKLNTASSLVVNGYHIIPPYEGDMAFVQSFALLAESTEAQSLNGRVAHELAGNLPAQPKTFRNLSISLVGGSTFTFVPETNNPAKPNGQRTSLIDSRSPAKVIGIND